MLTTRTRKRLFAVRGRFLDEESKLFRRIAPYPTTVAHLKEAIIGKWLQ